MKKNNYNLKKSWVYAIDDLLGCGDCYQTELSNEIINVVSKIMKTFNISLDNVFEYIDKDGETDGVIFGNNVLSFTNKTYRELNNRLELLFYRGYIYNKDIMELKDLGNGLDTFKQCFKLNEIKDCMNGDYYNAEYGDELYE